MNESVENVILYIQKTLYEGKTPDEDGNFIYTRKELAEGANISLSALNVHKEEIVDFLKKEFDFCNWAKYDDHKGENLFINVSYEYGKLSFQRNPLTINSELSHLWALPPAYPYFVYDVFDSKHRRRCNGDKQIFDMIPWSWGEE